MVQGAVWTGLQEPSITRRIGQVLSRQHCGAYHNGAGWMVPGRQRQGMYAVQRWIHTAPICQMDGHIRVLEFVFLQRQQPLSPVHIAVAQELISLILFNKEIEIRKVAGTIAETVTSMN